jgi:cyclophilin family peptidyl-prolyl cis-trans isomerase
MLIRKIKRINARKIVLFALCLLPVLACKEPKAQSGLEIAYVRDREEQKTERDVMVIETDFGEIMMLFNLQAAKTHSVKFKELANRGFFDGLSFHMIQPGLLIQGGDMNSRDDDPTDDGLGDPGFTLKAEIAMPHVRGSVGLAHPKGEPDLGNSQFYICLTAMPKLNGRYTVFGQVVEGMDTVVKISKVPLDENGRPLKKVVMKRVYIDRRVVALSLPPAS